MLKSQKHTAGIVLNRCCGYDQDGSILSTEAPVFLAIDSTDRTTFLSWHDHGVRFGRTLGEAKATEALLPAVLEILNQAQGRLSGLAVVTGPGAFTGIRVGIATVQGLALAKQVPAHGFSRFELLAPLVGDGLLALSANRHGAACQEVRAGRTQGEPYMSGLAELACRGDVFSQQPIEGMASRLLEVELSSLCLDYMLAGHVGALEPCYVRPADAVAAVPLITRLLDRDAGA